MNKIWNIAALLTCYNRKEKTLKCLELLYEAKLSEGLVLDIFLVDDGSTDGTGDAVKSQFSQVNVIEGDGSLFWNKGMRLAWDIASQTKDYDFFLWLNDDTELFNYAITELLECYSEILLANNSEVIISGACCSQLDYSKTTYGGRTDQGFVVPNGQIQNCKYINGNVVLVSKGIYKKLGNLSEDYTHGMGDFDYGLRALNAGFLCCTTKRFVAVCPNNEGIPSWSSPDVPFIKRWALLHSPYGLNLKEYNVFRKKFWGWKWLIFALKAYMKVLLPSFYNNLKQP